MDGRGQPCFAGLQKAPALSLRCCDPADPSLRFGISAAGSRFAHARKAPQVKPRWADGTARESVWESR